MGLRWDLVCWTDECFAGIDAADVKAVIDVEHGRKPEFADWPIHGTLRYITPTPARPHRGGGRAMSAG